VTVLDGVALLELAGVESAQLDSLSGDEQDIVDEAADGTFYADSSDNDAFDSLVDRFLAHEATETDDSQGKWLVRYDGQLYVADLEYRQYADDK